MKIAIVIPYFGRLPNYFQLFLNSCRINEDYTWLVFSDDSSYFDYPDNVLLHTMTFEECKNLIQSKFDFNISLNRPQKLCDYKCAYGYIFEEYLHNYDWWGHCDLDQIFGKINVFITENMLNKYVKIGSIGHFTLYKNDSAVNKLFMNELNGKRRFKEVFTSIDCCAFDEWYPENINEIFINSDKKIFLENYGADLYPYYTNFITTKFNVENRLYTFPNKKISIVKHEKGRIYLVWIENGEEKQEEYPYVHFQKRKLKDKRTLNSNDYYVIPNEFVDLNNNSKRLINKCLKYQFLNYQFFAVKWKSLQYRIKNGDWTFSHIPRDNT